MYSVPMTTPILHMNGTGYQTLSEGYSDAHDKLRDFVDAWGQIEFNSRDYYVNDSWNDALSERQEIAKKIREIDDYLTEIRTSIEEQNNGRNGK